MTARIRRRQKSTCRPLSSSKTRKSDALKKVSFEKIIWTQLKKNAGYFLPVRHFFGFLTDNSTPAPRADNIFCLGYTRFVVLEFASFERNPSFQNASYLCDFGPKSHEILLTRPNQKLAYVSCFTQKMIRRRKTSEFFLTKIWLFFGDQKNRERELNLNFFYKDTVHIEIPRLLTKQKI